MDIIFLIYDFLFALQFLLQFLYTYNCHLPLLLFLLHYIFTFILFQYLFHLHFFHESGHFSIALYLTLAGHGAFICLSPFTILPYLDLCSEMVLQFWLKYADTVRMLSLSISLLASYVVIYFMWASSSS